MSSMVIGSPKGPPPERLGLVGCIPADAGKL
jgi:hypothetical protein